MLAAALVVAAPAARITFFAAIDPVGWIGSSAGMTTIQPVLLGDAAVASRRSMVETDLRPVVETVEGGGHRVSIAISLRSDAATAIIDRVSRGGHDAVAIGSRRPPSFFRWLTGSVVDRVERGTGVPVLRVLLPAEGSPGAPRPLGPERTSADGRRGAAPESGEDCR